MSEILKILAANIQKYRKLSGITQEALALKLGVTFQAVSKWENARSSPDILLLPLMAEIFDCSIDSLFSYKPKNSLNNYEIKQIKKTIGDSESTEKFLSIIAMDGTDMSDEKIKKLVGEVYRSIGEKEDEEK